MACCSVMAAFCNWSMSKHGHCSVCFTCKHSTVSNSHNSGCCYTNGVDSIVYSSTHVFREASRGLGVHNWLLRLVFADNIDFLSSYILQSVLWTQTSSWHGIPTAFIGHSNAHARTAEDLYLLEQMLVLENSSKGRTKGTDLADTGFRVPSGHWVNLSHCIEGTGSADTGFLRFPTIPNPSRYQAGLGRDSSLKPIYIGFSCRLLSRPRVDHTLEGMVPSHFREGTS